MTDRPRFAPVSVFKFAVLSICSFGIYQVAWIYRQWKVEREWTGKPMSPFWRTFFAPVWLYDLLRRVRGVAEEAGVPTGWNAVLLSAVTILFWAASVLRQPWGLLSMLSFLPTLPVQHTINQLNARVAPGAPRNAGFTAANVALVVIGGLLVAIVIWSLFVTLPEVGQGTVDA